MVSKDELEQLQLQYKDVVRQSFDDFAKDLDFERKFGTTALQAKLQKEVGSDKEITEAHIKKAFDLTYADALNLRSDEMDNIFENGLRNVQKSMAAFMQPRYDFPQPQPGPNLQAGAQNTPTAVPKWTDRMDLSADPKISAAIANINNKPSADLNSQPMTELFKAVRDAAENKLKEAYRLRMAARMPPPRPSPKPQDNR